MYDISYSIMSSQESINQLQAKIDYMSQFVDLEKFIKGDKNSQKQILSYYRINHWAYKKFHSQDGFMHFRISKNGVYSDQDVYHQPNFISQFITENAKVVELGFGQGSNIVYLANRHPDAQFYGCDLERLKKKNPPQNICTFQQDYSTLPQFEDNSINVVYAIETIVHNTDKEKIYKEVYRILKPNGVFIVYDYALDADFDSFNLHIQKVIALISKGGAAAIIESLEQMHAHYTNSGLIIEQDTDYTREILPDLKRLEQKAGKIMQKQKLAKLMFRCLPEQFVANIILGYLGYDFGNGNVGSYHEWVLRK